MKNLLILYNPYYQSDVIKQHLKVLIDNEKVAFGKVRSKIKNIEHHFEKELQAIYAQTDSVHYLQLFLTDYANLFVAKVEKVTDEDMSSIAPNYYKEKSLKVEQWYIITDLKELVRDDFESVRDHYLANFTTPNFNNHTYAVYGNNYVYPLVVNMKKEVDYFEDKDTKHYPNIYKSKEYLQIKDALLNYSFGKHYTQLMHPNSIDNIISAQMEYEQNRQNPLYDFSSVVVKYTKTIEQEIYSFFKALIHYLSQKEPSILNVEYSVQRFDYKLDQVFMYKPNLGTYKYLLKHPIINKAIQTHCQKQFQWYCIQRVPQYIQMVQKIRNETVHGNPPTIYEVEMLKDQLIGIGCNSIIVELIEAKEEYLR